MKLLENLVDPFLTAADEIVEPLGVHVQAVLVPGAADVEPVGAHRVFQFIQLAAESGGKDPVGGGKSVEPAAELAQVIRVADDVQIEFGLELAGKILVDAPAQPVAVAVAAGRGFTVSPVVAGGRAVVDAPVFQKIGHQGPAGAFTQDIAVFGTEHLPPLSQMAQVEGGVLILVDGPVERLGQILAETVRKADLGWEEPGLSLAFGRKDQLRGIDQGQAAGPEGGMVQLAVTFHRYVQAAPGDAPVRIRAVAGGHLHRIGLIGGRPEFFDAVAADVKMVFGQEDRSLIDRPGFGRQVHGQSLAGNDVVLKGGHHMAFGFNLHGLAVQQNAIGAELDRLAADDHIAHRQVAIRQVVMFQPVGSDVPGRRRALGSGRQTAGNQNGEDRRDKNHQAGRTACQDAETGGGQGA